MITLLVVLACVLVVLWIATLLGVDAKVAVLVLLLIAVVWLLTGGRLPR